MQNLFNNIGESEKNRILEIHNIAKSHFGTSIIKEQSEFKNLSVLYNCLNIKSNSIEEIHLDEINQLLDSLFDATNSLDWGSDWDEEKITSALENANSQEVNQAQKALSCYMRSQKIQMQDNNPLLSICRTAFTSYGHTDISDLGYKKRAQKALKKLGILTSI